MSAPLINIKGFIRGGGGGKGTFSHLIYKGKLPGFGVNFYRKEVDCAKDAYLEVLAQEFFRLIRSEQPITLIAHNESLKTYHILSQEVLGYKKLPLNQQSNFTNGTYHGLGGVMVVALFLHEIDMKNGNICLDAHNRVIKIDGDWCFVTIKLPQSYKSCECRITEESLNALPLPKGFYTYNWLDIRLNNQQYKNHRIVSESLSTACQYQSEMNDAILRLLLLPQEYIRAFVDAYVPYSVHADLLIDFLINSQKELAIAVRNKQSFKEYCIVHGEAILAKSFSHMQDFVANGTYKIAEHCDIHSIKNAMTLRLAEFTGGIARKQALEKLRLLDKVNYDKHMDIFMHKKFQFGLKAARYPHYQKALDKVDQLCDALYTARAQFLESTLSYGNAKIKFKNECQSALNAVYEELNCHRQWQGALLQFFVDVIKFLTRSVNSQRVSFFGQTDSGRKLNELNQDLQMCF